MFSLSYNSQWDWGQIGSKFEKTYAPKILLANFTWSKCQHWHVSVYFTDDIQGVTNCFDNVQMEAKKLLRMPSFWKTYKVLYANIIYLYFLSVAVTLFSSLADRYFDCYLLQCFTLNISSIFDFCTIVSAILVKFTLLPFFMLLFKIITFASLNNLNMILN